MEDQEPIEASADLQRNNQNSDAEPAQVITPTSPPVPTDPNVLPGGAGSLQPEGVPQSQETPQNISNPETTPRQTDTPPSVPKDYDNPQPGEPEWIDGQGWAYPASDSLDNTSDTPNQPAGGKDDPKEDAPESLADDDPARFSKAPEPEEEEDQDDKPDVGDRVFYRSPSHLDEERYFPAIVVRNDGKGVVLQVFSDTHPYIVREVKAHESEFGTYRRDMPEPKDDEEDEEDTGE